MEDEVVEVMEGIRPLLKLVVSFAGISNGLRPPWRDGEVVNQLIFHSRPSALGDKGVMGLDSTFLFLYPRHVL